MLISAFKEFTFYSRMVISVMTSGYIISELAVSKALALDTEAETILGEPFLCQP